MLVCLALIVSCSPSKEEIDTIVSTSISNTQDAQSTNTQVPTATATQAPTEVPTYDAVLQIKSTLVFFMYSDIWTIEWGKNGNVSSFQYKRWDLEEHSFSGPGYWVHWEKIIQVKPGDLLMVSVYGETGADCIILIENEQVIKSTMSGGGKAVCEYEIP